MIFYDKDGEREYSTKITMIIVICWYSSNIVSESWSLDTMRTEGHTPIDFIKEKVQSSYLKCLRVYLSDSNGEMVEITDWYRPKDKE